MINYLHREAILNQNIRYTNFIEIFSLHILFPLVTHFRLIFKIF